MESGEADDGDAEALTVEKIEKTDPEKLEPLPAAEGLAVALRYEGGARDHKRNVPARGDGAAVKVKATKVKNGKENRKPEKVAMISSEREASSVRESDRITDPLLPGISRGEAMDQVRTIMESEMCRRQIEAVATILQDRSRSEQDRVSVDAVQVPNVVKVLYVGPFVLDEELHARAKKWKSRLESAYPRLRLEIDMKVADPPFHTDDIDCKGYWLKPEGREYLSLIHI